MSETSERGAPLRAETPPAGELATWPTRVLSGLVDLVAIPVIGGIVGVAVGLYAPSVSLIVSGLFGLLYLANIVGNYGYLQGTSGQSLGKRVAGTRLVSMSTGQPIGVLPSIARFFLHIIDSVILGIGYLFPIWDKQRQTIADKIMKTVVVEVDEQPAEPQGESQFDAVPWYESPFESQFEPGDQYDGFGRPSGAPQPGAVPQPEPGQRPGPARQQGQGSPPGPPQGPPQGEPHGFQPGRPQAFQQDQPPAFPQGQSPNGPPAPGQQNPGPPPPGQQPPSPPPPGQQPPGQQPPGQQPPGPPPGTADTEQPNPPQHSAEERNGRPAY